MSVTTHRIVALFVLFIETYLAGFIPLFRLKKCWDRSSEISGADPNNKVFQILLQFGGGVLFATVFVHLIPNIIDNFDAYRQSNQSVFKHNDNTTDAKELNIPYVEITICGGFFMIFLAEEVMHLLISRYHKHQDLHHNCHDRDLLSRGSCMSQDLQAVDDQQGETKGKDIEASNMNENQPLVRPFRPIDFTKGLVIIFAFSVHSLFDGLAIGLQSSVGDLWSVFLAISVHKVVIAFVISLQLYDQSRRLTVVAVHMAVFALMSPIGLLVVILSEGSLADVDETNPIVILLVAISSGTLIYIIFFEILQKDRGSQLSGLAQLASIFSGFVLMSILLIVITSE